ncbi:hypothetical protein ART_1602 [Arthrobacter sp. PAMC 25486]|uniref:hypothetical protein n=1 Tax=Arthrobacter sp. PAMC 25486 TaxID=1494608 RepID=UPI000535D6DE|nr:hypothetical protein [Arthrobacter sp. PAMC 25486]AIY01201.1 hypothetical protein ART_1602 [Arthrobacter sp. PAMC 25486]
MTCTTSDCNQPTDLYLCNQCVSDLQASIEYAHRLLPDLDVTIARLDVTRPGNPETRTTNVAGSAAPANMDALQLKLNMEAVTQTAAEYAHDPRVAGMAWLLGEWCKKAEVLISGPEAETPRDTAEIRQRMIREVPDSLTVPKLLHWLTVTHGIKLHPARIWKWAERGHITRTNEKGHATYSPAAVLAHLRHGASN